MSRRVMNRNVSSVFSIFAACSFALCVSQRARADDLSPPTWQRLGLANLSTSQEWEFLLNNHGPIAPDGNLPTLAGNGGAGPLATISPGPNMVWGPDVDADGLWIATQNAGSISMPIPNWVDTEPLKFLHLQVTYGSPNGVAGAPTFSFANVTNTDGPVVSVTQTNVNDFASGLQFQHVEDWQIVPNPDWELIMLNVPLNTSVDEVIIDTISVPEPASLALLGLVGVLVSRRIRRT